MATWLPPRRPIWQRIDASGIVLRIVKPESLAGKVIAYHFDFPEKWNAWYEADGLYEGMINESSVGGMGWGCDPGLKRVREVPEEARRSAGR